MARAQKNRPNSKKRGDTGNARRAEWAAGLISAAIVALMILWVAWDAVTETEVAPDFTVKITDRAPVESGYRVSFDIANKSPRTAATVVVRGEIVDGDATIEDADITFDYVPGQSRASGSVFFSQDPGGRPIRLRAIGYTEP